MLLNQQINIYFKKITSLLFPQFMGLKSFLVERKIMFFYSKGSFMVNTTEYYANNIRKHKFSFKLWILFIFI